MGWNEWPLMFFTVISQTALGAFWCCALVLLFGTRLTSEQKQRLSRQTFFVWAMMIAAFAISSIHLGSPWRGINVLIRVGQAPLSNESLFGGIFTGLGVLYWLLCWRRIGDKILRNILLLILVVCSIGFIWNVIRFYMMPTVPTWDTLLTPAAFMLTTVICGTAFACILFSRAGIVENNAKALLRWATLGAGCAVLVVIAQSASLPAIQSSIQKASELSPDYGILMVFRFVLTGLGLALWYSLVRRRNYHVFPYVICLLMLMVAEWIGRGVFYALYMTVGLV